MLRAGNVGMPMVLRTTAMHGAVIPPRPLVPIWQAELRAQGVFPVPDGGPPPDAKPENRGNTPSCDGEERSCQQSGTRSPAPPSDGEDWGAGRI